LVFFEDKYQNARFDLDPGDETYDEMGEDDECIDYAIRRTSIIMPVLRIADLAPYEPKLVTDESPPRLQAAVYSAALAFKREMHLDFLQFYDPVPSATGGGAQNAGSPWEAWLFGSQAYETRRSLSAGSACFYQGVYAELPHTWTLSWVWIHPYDRRRRHITKAWPMWTERYGDFLIERPISDPMISLIAKVGYEGDEHLRTKYGARERENETT
jgi:hypothetical protein